MNVIICDDDKKDIERLKDLLKKFGSENSIQFDIASFLCGEELLEDAFKGMNVDIVFLDINLTGIDGIKTAGRIREIYPDVPIVFITAYINYALDGYKVRANRFLVKDDLEHTFPECMDDICREISRKTKSMVFRCMDGEHRISLTDIILFETSGRQLVIHGIKQQYTMYEKIDELEEKLSVYGFIRIHRCYLVNIRYITGINNYLLKLVDGRQLQVPKGRYRDVKEKYTLFVGDTI